MNDNLFAFFIVVVSSLWKDRNLMVLSQKKQICELSYEIASITKWLWLIWNVLAIFVWTRSDLKLTQ